MKRYSLNSLKNSFELGTISNWVISFEPAGGDAPDTSAFNLITTLDGDFAPVIDCNYDQSIVTSHEFNIGPNLNFKVPIYEQTGTSAKLTFYDDHEKSIHNAIINWNKKLMSISKGKAPALNELKEICLLMIIYKFDKKMNPTGKDALYVVPDGTKDFMGDQSFSADQASIEFNIMGVQ